MATIERFRVALSGIPDEKRGEIRTKLVPWVYTNDHQFGKILPALEDLSKRQHRNGRVRVGILSGVGALLCIAPYVDVDCFVSVDRNSFVLDRVKEMVEGIKQASTRDEYRTLVQSENYFHVMKQQGIDTHAYWQMEYQSFGQQHFLATDEAYARSRAVMLTRPVLYAQGNFTHRPFVETLAAELADGEVSYLNVTDLCEWSPVVFDLLPTLPVAQDVLVSWSTNKTGDGQPIARLSQGLDVFVQEALDAAKGASVTYFQTYV